MSQSDVKSAKPLSLRILNKDYVIACPEEERETLQASANYLNQHIESVRKAGKVVGTERMVVISALHIIQEYFQYRQEHEGDSQSITAKLQQLQDKIDLALTQIKH